MITYYARPPRHLPPTSRSRLIHVPYNTLAWLASRPCTIATAVSSSSGGRFFIAFYPQRVFCSFIARRAVFPFFFSANTASARGRKPLVLLSGIRPDREREKTPQHAELGPFLIEPLYVVRVVCAFTSVCSFRTYCVDVSFRGCVVLRRSYLRSAAAARLRSEPSDGAFAYVMHGWRTRHSGYTRSEVCGSSASAWRLYLFPPISFFFSVKK